MKDWQHQVLVGYETTGFFIHCWWEDKQCNCLGKTVGWFLIKLKIKVYKTYNPIWANLNILEFDIKVGMSSVDR